MTCLAKMELKSSLSSPFDNGRLWLFNKKETHLALWLNIHETRLCNRLYETKMSETSPTLWEFILFSTNRFVAFFMQIRFNKKRNHGRPQYGPYCST